MKNKIKQQLTPYIITLFATVLMFVSLSMSSAYLANGKIIDNLIPWGVRRGIDLTPVIVASRSMIAGHSIYKNNSKYGRPFTDFLAKDDEVRYVYPPLAAYLFAPLTLFSKNTAYIIWSFTQIAIILAIIAVFCRSLKFSLFETMAISTVLLLSYPVWFSIERGNFDVLVMLFYSLAIYCWLEKKQDLLVALFLAVAILLKLFPFAFIFFFIFKKKWNIVLYTIIISMFLTIIAGLGFIPEYGGNFVSLLMRLGRHLFVANHSTVCFLLRAQAISGYFSENATRTSIYLSHLINLSLLGFIAYHSWKWGIGEKLTTMLELCAYMLFMSVASAISYDYKLVFMCFAIPVLIRGMAEMNREKTNWVLTVIIFICLAHCLSPTWCLIDNHSNLLMLLLASKFPFMITLIFAIVRMNAVLIKKSMINTERPD